MARYNRTKKATEILYYTIDWALTALLDTGETVSSSAWSATTGITVVVDSSTSTTTSVWVSGGTAGEQYKLTNTITTVASPQKTLVREIFVRVI